MVVSTAKAPALSVQQVTGRCQAAGAGRKAAPDFRPRLHFTKCVACKS